MARNFLRCVAEWEQKYLIRQIKPSTELQKAVVSRLKNYIVECTFSKSKITDFYCKNYDKSYSQLSALWKTVFGTVKSEDSVRGQVGAISRQLIELFGGVNTIETALQNADKSSDKVSDEERNEAIRFLRDLILKIDGLEQVDDETDMILFAVDINKLAGLSSTSNVYELSDCRTELKLLKTLSVRGIQSLFDDISTDKISYLLQVLNQPVIINEVQEYEKDGRTRHVYKKRVNMNKVELLKEFEVITPAKLRTQKNSKVKEGISSVEDISKSVENIKPVVAESGVEPKAELPFRFAEMIELCEVIQERLNDSYSADAKKNAKNISTLKLLFGLFTKNGLRSYLARYDGEEISQVINYYYRK